ncbi:hypothetical protein CKC_01450 [Candidatus Liberibacter solanacearum CLso-ZC1]|uniref:Uncharacterized protein n=1 Tax=Liberibacter solanacearum (strain CLso-ZC1) TaxID=658172 RepID=E4UCF1_LIBSC|nr:hypothetical protein CKC_01450 [Candidatus Liberibacter solanacearum CLso-ZC1]
MCSFGKLKTWKIPLYATSKRKIIFSSFLASISNERTTSKLVSEIEFTLTCTLICIAGFLF